MISKKGICIDCADDREKYITAGRCEYHYKKHRSQFWKKSEKKPNRIKPVSVKQSARIRRYTPIRKEFLEKNPLCMMRLVPECSYWATEVHHSMGRIGDLLFDIETFVAACPFCHPYAEEHPEECYQKNISASRLSI